MYNLIEYSEAYSKTSGSLCQHQRDEPALDNNGNIIDFLDDNNNNASFKFKQKITGQTGNSDTKDTEIMVPLKYLSNFLRTLAMSLVNCKISLQLKWSKLFIVVPGTANYQNRNFQINDTKLYVPIATLSTQENIKLLKQLARNRYLDYLIGVKLSRSKQSFCFVI